MAVPMNPHAYQDRITDHQKEAHLRIMATQQQAQLSGLQNLNGNSQFGQNLPPATPIADPELNVLLLLTGDQS